MNHHFAGPKIMNHPFAGPKKRVIILVFAYNSSCFFLTSKITLVQALARSAKCIFLVPVFILLWVEGILHWPTRNGLVSFAVHGLGGTYSRYRLLFLYPTRTAVFNL